jgi:protein involved in polysaccharide export with SLBB domain
MAATGALGCGTSEIGRYGWQEIVVRNPQRVRNAIVKTEDYWIQREVEPEEAFPGPAPTDLTPPETDYILGPGDLVDITVYELVQPNQPYVSRQRLSQSGQVTLPYIGTVKAGGLTVRGLEEKIADILEPDYIVDPQVTVFVQEFRNLSVSVLNGLFRPGVYQMTKQDMHLLELVATAGGVTQLIEDYGYVIREYSPEEADLLMLEAGAPPPEAPAAPAAAKEPAPEAGPPGVTQRDRDLLQKMAEGAMPEVRKIEKAEVSAGGAGPAVPPAPAPAPAPPPPAPDEQEVGRWIWEDGKWVEVKGAEPPKAAPPVTAVAAAEAAPGAAPPAPAAPEEARLRLERKLARLGVVQGSGQLKRIIRFDVKALMAGDPTQNVVLRDGDIVTIPSLAQGDFFMTGQVARPGVYSLTGRKITLLQAVAAAGGLTAVAVPWRTEVVRRIAEDEQEFIYADIAKIARGEVPDFYIHPEDIIRVGTDQAAVWDAVLRNAFRATYGLGAVYDTNFADFYPWTDAVYPLFPGLH